MLSANDSNSCARSYLVCAGWQSWPMLAIRQPCWRWTRLRMRLAWSVLTRSHSKSGEPRSSAQALYVCADPLVSSNLARINTLALGARLPTMHGVQEYVEAGGLMSYGANFSDLFRRAAEFVNKILRGAQPADIPVEQPTRFELVIN